MRVAEEVMTARFAVTDQPIVLYTEQKVGVLRQHTVDKVPLFRGVQSEEEKGATSK